VVNETDPSARVFEEHVDLLLERLSLALMEHVLGLERLVDGQVDRVVRVRDAGRGGRLAVRAGRDHLDDGRVVRVAAGRRRVGEVLARLPALLQRRGHAPVVRLAEPRHPPVMVRRPGVRGVRRRPPFLRRTLLAAGAAVEPQPPPLLLIVADVLFRTSAVRPPLARPAKNDRVAVTVAAAAVAPQRHFPGLAEQLHLLGAVHVNAERPRQHPAAAVRMAFNGRFVDRRRLRSPAPRGVAVRRHDGGGGGGGADCGNGDGSRRETIRGEATRRSAYGFHRIFPNRFHLTPTTIINIRAQAASSKPADNIRFHVDFCTEFSSSSIGGAPGGNVFGVPVGTT